MITHLLSRSLAVLFPLCASLITSEQMRPTLVLHQAVMRSSGWELYRVWSLDSAGGICWLCEVGRSINLFSEQQQVRIRSGHLESRIDIRHFVFQHVASISQLHESDGFQDPCSYFCLLAVVSQKHHCCRVLNFKERVQNTKVHFVFKCYFLKCQVQVRV